MGGYQTFYPASGYELSPSYGDPISTYTPVSSFGMAVDPRTANQIKEVSSKLSSGTKSIEVQLALPDVVDSIPDQHLEEINRLRKLVGADLTVHGILEEPTGAVSQDRWDPTKREHAERHMWQSIDRAHKVNPDGNVVVTFHSSNGLPEAETWEFDPKTGDEKRTKIAVINERTGEIAPLTAPRRNILEAPGEEPDALDEFHRANRDQWINSLSEINSGVTRAKELLNQTFSELGPIKDLRKEGVYARKPIPPAQEEALLNLYSLSQKDSQEYRQKLNEFVQSYAGDPSKEGFEKMKERIVNDVEEIGQVDIYLRQAYNQFKESFSGAYEVAERKGNKEDIAKLDRIGASIRKSIDKEQGYLKDRTQLSNFANTLRSGVEEMNSMGVPEIYRPLKEFAVDKASETFSNIAAKAYKKFGSTAPVVSVENPPTGMGLSRAKDIKDIVVESRKKFEEKMVKDGLSRSEAKQQAKKLIGATWDVGHINMLRKYGADDKKLLEETEKIAPFVNKIHLSDNFGMQHTELPMGMGNVPTKGHIQKLKEAHGEKLKEIKQVIEAGNWYQHFQSSPFAETLAAFGSPVGAGAFTPYWNQQKDVGYAGGYFSGYGFNPGIHHSIYGAGFSNLPVELGGQVPGTQNRFSGAPME